QIFEQMLAEVSRYEAPLVFCYGSYERTFLKRMRKAAERKRPVGRVLGGLVNVLSLVHAHLYFPCHSNGLKDVAGCLGCSWGEREAPGQQSLVWRARWEETRDERWKEKLLTYNREDCQSLRKVTDFVAAVRSRPGPADAAMPASNNGPQVAWVEELDRLGMI